MDPSGANVKVNFDGSNADGNLVVAMFNMWPPMGPPTKSKKSQRRISGICSPPTSPGNYTARNPRPRLNPNLGPEDVSTNVEINVPTANWFEVELIDPFEDLEIEDIEYAPSSDLYVSNSNPYGPGKPAVTTTEVAAGMNGAPVDMLL